MPTPNLFDYATKELSQDAMICWLIAWSQTEPENGADQALRDLGREFVKALLATHGMDLAGDIRALEIHQQKRGIDVLVRFQDEKTTHVLLIEGKVDTHPHNNQLERYYNMLINENILIDEQGEPGPVPEGQIRAIYLKTGNQSCEKDRFINEKTPFMVFNRQDFLGVLNTFQGNHPIAEDFRRHLQGKEDEYNSFEQWTHNDRNEWKWAAWERFYRCLEDGLGCGDWKYVPIGGFLGFSWHGVEITDGVRLYLQLEVKPDNPDKQKLCFKVAVDDKDKDEHKKKERRLLWRDRCRVAIRKAGGHRARMGRPGKTMTVAHWQGEWLAFNDGGLLNIDATVENLEAAQEIVDGAAEPLQDEFTP